MIKENGNVDDFFLVLYKGNMCYLDIEMRDDELEYESVVGYEDYKKFKESVESERKYCMEDFNKIRELYLELLKE